MPFHPPTWERKPLEDPGEFVRERITSMGLRPLMYAQTREAFAVEVWALLRMLGVYVPMPGFHESFGPSMLHLSDQPSEEYARWVTTEALRIIQELEEFNDTAG